MYTNVRSMENKHDELETFVQLQGYDLLGIMEMWWDASHDWSVAIGTIQALEEGQDAGWEDEEEELPFM